MYAKRGISQGGEVTPAADVLVRTIHTLTCIKIPVINREDFFSDGYFYRAGPNIYKKIHTSQSNLAKKHCAVHPSAEALQ